MPKRFVPLSGNRHTLASDTRRAFTLIELLVVVAVLGLLLALLLPTVQGVRSVAKRTLRGFSIIANPFGTGSSSNCETNYGLNKQSKFLTVDANKVLAMDYYQPVADVVGPTAPDPLNWASTLEKVAAKRHTNTVNVVFVDGRVENVSPDEIDPRVSVLHNVLWCPTATGGLNLP